MIERAEFVDRFAEVLAERLGRVADELRDSGLSASDFSGDCRVRWHDGSEAMFRGAFAVVDPGRKRIGVFTEHCGYFDFDQVSILSVDESSTNRVYDSDFA